MSKIPMIVEESMYTSEASSLSESNIKEADFGERKFIISDGIGRKNKKKIARDRSPDKSYCLTLNITIESEDSDAPNQTISDDESIKQEDIDDIEELIELFEVDKTYVSKKPKKKFGQSMLKTLKLK
jgi:hypothetical protein